MHFEVPNLPHSVKEFAAHYVMIVVSILTALGLEAGVERLHHAHAAESAQRAIEAELRATVADIDEMNRRNFTRIQPMKDIATMLEQDFQQGVPAAQMNAEIAARVKAGIDLGLFIPTLRHEAWDVAVANQSATWIAPATLRRLSALYAEQRDASTVSLTPLFDGPRFLDAITDARIGKADPQEFLRVMRQGASTLESAHSRYQGVAADIRKVLDAEASPEADAASAPASARAASS